MGRKRTLRVRKWHHPGGRGWGYAAARWGGWRIPENEPYQHFPCGHGRTLHGCVWRGRTGAIAGALSLAAREPVGCAQPRTIGGAGPAAGRNQVAGGCPNGGKSPGARATPPAASVQTADPFGEEFTLEPKKVVVIKGTANWDSAFDTLIDSFKALTALLDKQGIKASGNSMIVYTSTDDTGFTFLAEIPVDRSRRT
jgi:Bacterial transcription activator, effector binding domain.